MSIEVKIDSVSGEETYEVIQVHVSEGDYIKHDDTVIVLEGDKATIDVTAQIEGGIQEIKGGVGQRVSDGDIYLRVEPSHTAQLEQQPVTINNEDTDKDVHADVVVIGAGPGGYTAAFRAADLGLNVVLVERYDSLGGVCLNVGCIPSKSLLHVAKVINEAKEVSEFGVEFEAPKINIDKLRSWKDDVLSNLTGGIKDLSKMRNVKLVHGEAKFLNANELSVSGDETQIIKFKHAIIAAGSHAIKVPNFPKDPRIIDSADALALDDVPERLLIIGGGIIGLEMATVYHALGSRVTVAAKYDQLLPDCDEDIVKPLLERIEQQYENIYFDTLATQVEATDKELIVTFDDKGGAPETQAFDKILVTIGRRPNGNRLDAHLAGVNIDDRGFIPVNQYQQTNVDHIFAIGDIVGQPMLAHKALHEAKVAAEVAAGHHSRFDAKVIPSVAYTDPEVAWVGVSEKQAKQQGIKYGVGVFPWAASGRAMSLGRAEGKTKLLFDLVTDEIIGGGIVGVNAGDLIAEVAVAIENKNTAKDLAATIHPHPTLSETVAFASEVFEGSITDLYLGKKTVA